MAFAMSVQSGQIPVGCELCNSQKKIKFKCLDCNLLMCSECKDRVHFRIAKDHQVTDIKDIGKRITFRETTCENHKGQPCCLFCQTCKTFICLKCIAIVHNGHKLIDEEVYNKKKVFDEEVYHKEKVFDEEVYNKKKVFDSEVYHKKKVTKPKQQQRLKFEISIERVYKTDLNSIQYIAMCSDGSMLIGNATSSKLQHVKFRENRIKVLTSLNTELYGIAKNNSNNFLVATNSTKLKLINTFTGQVTDSRYDVKPFTPTSVHVSNDYRVMVGAVTPGNRVATTGRRVVIILDQNGKHLREYEFENHSNKQLFDLPIFITSTCHGSICVVDWSDKDDSGRVVVLAPSGDILGIYAGHPDVNTEKDPFKPVGILTTPSDNIVVTDLNNHHLHILTNMGQSITYYNLYDIGIVYPISLALSTPGTIYLGCVNKLGSAETTKAKLYELYYSGF